MTEQGRRTSKPTAEQKSAREELAASRDDELERMKRTRELIMMGEVLASYGLTKAEQLDELIRVLSERDSWVGWLRRRGVELRRDGGR